MKPIQIFVAIRNEEELSDIRCALDKLQLYYAMSHATSAAHVLQSLEDCADKKILPALILIDNDFEDSDCRKLLRDIRAKKQWEHIPCFLLVSPGNPTIDFDSYAMEGFAGCINKPFSISGPGTSGSLNLAMDLMNQTAVSRL